MTNITIYLEPDTIDIDDLTADETLWSAKDAEQYVPDPDATLVNALTETVFLAEYADTLPPAA